MVKDNKVTFGLKNVHFAKATTDETGTITYGTPVRLPGGVELSLEPRGDMTEFYADDVVFYSSPNNNGYEGTLTIAKITDEFATDILGEKKHATDMVLTEFSNTEGSPFALLFEFDGDVKATRHVIYQCTANRPTVSSTTKNETKEPNTNELTFTSTARASDYAVKTRTSSSTPEEVYNAWYSEVYDLVEAV